MNYYKIIVAYDGTAFHGWQIQPHDQTLSSALQDAWFQFMRERITILGASRTDAGVHALGQVARFGSHFPERIPLEQLRKAWNQHLPPGIYIRSLEPMPRDFHPCGNVLQKTYYYTLFLKKPLPMVERFGWYPDFMPQVDIDKFERALQRYIGTHDFASFCKIDQDDKKDTVRTIDSIKLHNIARWGILLVEIKGKSFVRFQIRRMVGYALDIAHRPTMQVEYLDELLKNPNPRQLLVKADAKGLCLRRIVYKRNENTSD
jgi:tRNA pseudouridine38-40 synthase